MSNALILAVQGVLAVLLTGYFSVQVARISKKANDKTAEVQDDANAIAGFHQLVADLQSDISRLRSDHNELSAKHAELGRHVDQLERESRRDKTLIRHLIVYIRTLIAALRAAGAEVPEAPAGIDLEGGPLD